ncbi:MAG: iron ABC transporter permease [Pseudomonadota bacterium]
MTTLSATVTRTVKHNSPPRWRHWSVGWTLSSVLIGLFVSIPLITVVSHVFLSGSGNWQHLASTVLPGYVSNSLLLMLGVGCLSTVIGVGTAWCISAFSFPGRDWLAWAQLLPLAMPAYILAYCYTDLLEFAGPVQTALRDWFDLQPRSYYFPEIRSLGGAIVVLSLVLYPYTYLLTRAAFNSRSMCAIEAGRTLGCSGHSVFWRVALPLARPAILAGLALVLMETLADFGAVDYFGVATFTTGIFRTWFGMFDATAALQLSAVLLGFVVLLLALERYSRGHSRYNETTDRVKPTVPIELRSRTRWLVTCGCAAPVVLGFIIPSSQLVWLASRRWQAALETGFLELLWNSVSLAMMTALIVLVPAFVLVFAQRNKPNTATLSAIRFSTSGYAIPGTVIALAVLIPFGMIDNAIDRAMEVVFGWNTGLLLSGTLFTLIFAYCVRFLTAAFNSLESGLAQLKPSVEEAAYTLGATRHRVLKDLYVPAIRGSVLTAILIVFVDTLKELPATLVLRPFNFNTLAVKTYELASDERLSEAALPALAIVCAGLIPVILISRGIRRSRPGLDTIGSQHGHQLP